MRIIICFMCLLLSACATTQNYQTTVDSWEGSHAQELFSSWGYPDVTEKTAQGHHLYIYNTANNASKPAPEFPGRSFSMTEEGNTLDPEAIAEKKAKAGLDCKTVFEADRSNRIVSVSFTGTQCRAKRQFAQFMGNPKVLQDDD